MLGTLISILTGYEMRYLDYKSFLFEYIDIYRRKIFKFKTNNVKPVIFDLGGNIGMQDLYFKKIYPSARITVFEPDPKIFKILKYNININKIRNVNLINVGVGKKMGSFIFYPDGSDGGSAIIKNKNLKPISVKIVRLSKYMNTPIDLLKMNIEGLECEVFEEIQHKLYLVKQIIFEYHCFSDLRPSLGKILNILEKNKFEYLVTDSTGAMKPPLSLENRYRYFNIIYARRIE